MRLFGRLSFNKAYSEFCYGGDCGFWRGICALLKELVKSLNPRLAFCYWTGVIVTPLHGNVRAPVSPSPLVERGWYYSDRKASGVGNIIKRSKTCQKDIQKWHLISITLALITEIRYLKLYLIALMDDSTYMIDAF